MPDRATEAVARMWEALVAVHGRDVVISRGATSLGPIKAVKGSVILKLSDPMGGTRTLRTKDDYLVKASDYLTTFGEPEQGDRTADIGEGKSYEAASPGGEEAHWRYTDGTHVLIRIHTKEAPP